MDSSNKVPLAKNNHSDSGSSDSSSDSSGSSSSSSAVGTDSSNKTPVATIVLHGDDDVDITDLLTTAEDIKATIATKLTVLQGLSARLHLLQILKIHLARVGAVTRRYTHHFCVENLS
jgi:hypothetical protein